MPRKTLKKESVLDKFRQWIKHLRIKSKQIPVIVRSEIEKKRLKALKIKNIYVLRDPYYSLAEKLAKKYKEAILLFDVTKSGQEVYEKLQREFELVGIKIDNRFRQFLYHNKRKTVRGILTYIEKYLFSGLNPRKTTRL